MSRGFLYPALPPPFLPQTPGPGYYRTMDSHELAMTALRAAGVFFFMLLVIRLLGKRTVGNFTAFDLLVALMLGEVVDEIIYGDVTMAQGIVAIVVLAAAKYLTSWLNYLDHGLNAILEGTPRPVVEHGRIDHRALRAEIMNEKELMATLRLQGIADLREVKLATVETDGEVSVVREDWAEPLRKGDVEQRREAQTDPPPSQQTDSPRALGR